MAAGSKALVCASVSTHFFGLRVQAETVPLHLSGQLPLDLEHTLSVDPADKPTFTVLGEHASENAIGNSHQESTPAQLP